MTAPEPYVRDATGKPVRVGDIAGGTTSGRYQATIYGPVRRLSTHMVTILCTQEGDDGVSRPKAGDETKISRERVFLVRSRDDRPCTCSSAGEAQR